MIENDDATKPQSLDEILGQTDTVVKPKAQSFGFPIGVGRAKRFGEPEPFSREESTEDIPDGAVIGARIK